MKSDNFCYRKVGRPITKWGAIERSSKLLSQYWKMNNALKNIFQYDNLHLGYKLYDNHDSSDKDSADKDCAGTEFQESFNNNIILHQESFLKFN